MNRYPRSIRYALSTYSNNPKKKRNTSESQRIHSVENNAFLNPNNNKLPNDNINPSSTLKNNDQQYLFNNNKKNEQMEEYKSKTEARQLIEQTKKMMEEYSLNKLKKNNNNKKLNLKINGKRNKQ